MNRIVLIILLGLLVLAGCQEEETQKVTSPTTPEAPEDEEDVKETEGYTLKHTEPTYITIGDQEFEVVPAFDSTLDYIEFMEENPLESKTEAYASKVVNPFRQEEFGDTRGGDVRPPKNIDALRKSVQKLDSSYEEIVHSIEESLEKSVERVQLDRPTKIYVFPFNPDQLSLIDEMDGVLAHTTDALVWFEIDPEHYTEEALSYTMAHEYHHLAYFEMHPERPVDLVEEALVEGKADAFAEGIYPEAEFPWTKELTKEEETEVINWVNERRYTYEVEDLIEFSGGNDSIPKWADYRMGLMIIEDFIRNNPEITVEEWTKMGPEEILKGSRFADDFDGV